MATTKITITFPGDRIERIQKLIEAGRATVCPLLKHAVGIALFDAAGRRQLLQEALNQTGGPLTKKERAWADGLLTPRRRAKRPRRLHE